MRKLLLGPLLFGLVALSTSARADAEADRTALFKEGLALAEKSDWAGAAERFRKVVELRSAPKALFTLGQAEQHLGHFTAAKAAFERAKRDSGPTDAAVAKAAGEALKEVTPHLARVIVTLPPDAGAASITVDGAAATAGEPGLEVDPGTHHIRAELAGRKAFEADVQAVDGGRAEVATRFDPLAAPVAERSPVVVSPSDQGSPKPSLLPPLAVAGAGAAFMIVGAVVFATGRSSYDSAAATCPTTKCGADATSQASSARGQMIAGDALLFGGAAVVVASGAWLALRVLTKPKPRDTGSRSPGATSWSAAVTPSGAFGSLSVRY